MPETLAQRLLRRSHDAPCPLRVDVCDRPIIGPCWLWLGYVRKNGYGQVRLPGSGAAHTNLLVHRAAFEEFVGPIPDGWGIDHLCKVRSCCNPSHLDAVDQAENVARGNGGGHHLAKTHCPSGHPYDEENTYRGRHGRFCRACGREATRRWYERKKGIL